ncbi:MAG TPA: hypothetical protein VJU59_32530 [Paraburkholderia sp.]|uniref:hypothetical protein n=1 Tax=Paraburkholderia sp. TaxID=1926495 RepID=UPI002B4810AF|nr:hypothetical protein [Paraburkholderia sp.]HKR44348.1 hypothetical protein [Paraburkholderia sp.]
MEWILERERAPTRDDGPMANTNKVQVEILTPSGTIERRNYFVAGPTGGFDDYDLRPVKAWRPLAHETPAQPFRKGTRW